jgi:hypothetical protein
MERFAVAVGTDFQLDFSAFPAHDAYNRRAVFIKGTMSPDLIGSPSWRIRWVLMRDPLLSRVLIHLIGFRDLIIES